MSLPIIITDRLRAYPPRATAFTRTFWDGLATGRFLVTRCPFCRRATFPPKPFCPHCWHRETVWEEAGGRGKLYAQTVIHAAPAMFSEETPLHVGIVDLDEGLRIATRVLDEPTAALDDAVELVVLQYRDGPLYGARGLG